MINILPEPKRLLDKGGFTPVITGFCVSAEENLDEILDLCQLRFWNCPGVAFSAEAGFPLQIVKSLDSGSHDSGRQRLHQH